MISISLKYNILLFVADSFYNNDGNSILSDNCSLSAVSEQNVIFEIEDSANILNSAEDGELRKAQKTATISSFKTKRNIPYPLPTSRPAKKSSSSESDDVTTSSRKCKDKILLLLL